MISILTRRLPRSTAAAALRCARPTVVSITNDPQPMRSSPTAFLSTTAGNGTLTRDAIADILADEYDLSGAESKRILATVFDTIVESVTKKDTVTIPGFGKFEAVEVAAQGYTNPQNPTEKIWKPATTRVKFRPFKHFKECVAEGKMSEK